MDRRAKLLAVVLLASLTAACQPQMQEAASAALSDADLAAIRSVPQAYAQAVLAGDAAAVAATYTEDGVEMPPNLPAREGRAAILEWYEAGLQVTAFSVTSVDTDGRGDVAYDRGTFSITLTPPGMTEPMDDTGKYLVILRKQSDGSWAVTTAIWNSDLPLPEPESEAM